MSLLSLNDPKPGVNESQKLPVRRLNASGKQKLLFALTVLLYMASAIGIPFVHINLEKEGRPVVIDRTVIYQVAILWLVQYLATLYEIYAVYRSCYLVQIVKCTRENYDSIQGQKSHLALVYLIWCICSLTLPDEPAAYALPFGLVQIAWLVAATLVHIKYCKCKNCRNIKDVEIWYKNECVELFESVAFSSKYLERDFDISLSWFDSLALQLEDGTLIHTFPCNLPAVDDSKEMSEDEYEKLFIQLYAGRYNVIMRSNSEDLKK